jgi:hypothetical protein
LIEMLAALAIAGAIFGVIAEFSGRLLLNWNRSEATISIMEMLTRGLGRLGSDLALALPMSPPGSDGTITYFSGDPTHLTFVAATGFGVGDRGLELLNFSMTDRNDDFYLVRTRAPVSNPPSEFKDPVLLLHGRMQVRFAYRDANGQLVDSWNKRPDLPTAIAVQVIGAGGPVFPRALMFPVPVNLSVDCLLPEDETIRPTRCSGPEAPQQPASAATGNPRNNGQ